MPRFKVMTYNRGTWDRIEPRIVEARDEKEAAERVCGAPLVPGSNSPGNLRAKVWPADTKVALFSALYG
jgi:hypothetical protein